MKKSLMGTVTAAAFFCSASGAYAVDFGGYFRAGPSSTKDGARTACYTLNPGAGMKYRLGNECDFYGEFALSQTGKAEGLDYKVTLMTNLHNGGNGSDTNSQSLGINQLFVEGKGFDFAPETTFWVGKRFYGRTDVYIIDTKFTQLDGVGAGAIIPAGPGKLGVSFYRTDGGAAGSGPDGTDVPGTRLNIDYSGVQVNEGGTLSIVTGLTKGNFSTGTSGGSISVLHSQAFGPNLRNNLWVQYAKGSAGLNGNFGSLTAASGVNGVRVADSLTWQSGALGGQAVVMWERDKDAAGVATDLGSAGGRIAYAFTRNFKLLGEAGYSQKQVGNNPTAKLAKFTIAPALSTGPEFMKRPELRLYVTTAKWNSAAGNVTGRAAFAGETQGTSYGAQVEMWF
jgi:maltoporin